MSTTATVSDYIAHTPPAARKALKQIRAAIKAAAPGITERITRPQDVSDLSFPENPRPGG